MTFKYFNVKNGLTTGNIALHSSNGNVVANTFVGNLNVTGSANLGGVSNLIITGGTANYVLTTDGAGNLSWTAPGAAGGITSVSDNFTGNGVQNTFTLSTTPADENLTFVNYNGAFLLRADYTISGNTITFSTPPGNGYYIEVTTLGGNGGGGGGGGGGANIANGNSNVSIATANGNITMAVAGNANVVTVTGTGANITGTLNVTGNANAGNVGATGGVFTTVAGALTTAAQPNITSVGTLSSLTVSGNVTAANFVGQLANGNSDINIPAANGNINFDAAGNANVVVITGTGLVVNRLSNLGPVGNVTITGGSSGQVLTTNGSGGLSWSSVGTGDNISNGNSTVSIPAANGNINLNAGGSATPELVVTTTGVNVTGTFQVTGVSTLGPNSNVKITGGSSGQVLSTDGAGNLSWVAQSGGGGGVTQAKSIVLGMIFN